MTIVHKTGTRRAAGGEGLSFVLSDATVDRYGDTIDPNGWDLRNFRQNPIALFGHDANFPIGKWTNLRVEKGQLVGDLAPAKKGTSPRVDEVISLVEQDILVATSVGFKPIEAEPRKGGGIDYKRQELLEASIVGVPANPAAVAVMRSMVSDGRLSADTVRMAMGEQALEVIGTGRGFPGEHAANPTPPQRTNTMSLSERIKQFEEALVAKRDRLTELTSADVLDLDAIEEVNLQIDKDTAAVEGLKKSEASLGFAAARSQGAALSIPAEARKPLGSTSKQTRPADLLIRSAIVHGIAGYTNKDPVEIGERMYGDDRELSAVVKAAVAPATTTTAGWAAELVNTMMDDFLETLRPVSVYPQLAAAGGGRLAFGPNAGAIKIPARSSTPSIGGSFVGEGAAIPVRRLALTSVTLTPRKMGVITTFTREMARYSSIQLEPMLRQEIIFDTAITLDSVLLGTAAGDAITPAGLLNGVSALTATAGGGAAAFLGDIRKLRAPFDTANAPGGLMLLMNPAQAEGLALTAGPDGTLGFAEAIVNRYNVATSTAIPVGRVIMVRAADFATATGDVPEFEISNDATVHMEDSSPLAIGTTGAPNTVAAPVRSFFQTGVSGLRMMMDVTWAMRRTGVVQYIDSVTW